jgi:hypothetical protein
VTGRAGNTDGPENVDAAFAEIVAGLQRDGMCARWPEDQPATRHDSADRHNGGQEASGQDTAPAEETRPIEPPTPPPGWRVGDKEWDWASASDEEHYVPPDPPPFPRPRPMTVLAIGLIALGIALLAIPSVIGLDTQVATPLALIALTSGVGWLLLRMRHGPPSDDGGAQL